jgi:hypothetical protein
VPATASALTPMVSDSVGCEWMLKADVLRVRAQLEREYGLGALAGVGPDLTRAQEAAALGIEQQLGHAFVAGEAERAPDAAQGKVPFSSAIPWALASVSERPIQATSGSG